MNTFLKLLVISSLSLFSSANSIPRNFEATLDNYINPDKFVGLSIIVLKKDGSKFKKHYGFRDIKNKLKPNDNTVYEIGSISKVFARIALAAQNKIKLKDDISLYLPNTIRVPRPAGEDITIENLITHMGIMFSVPCTIRLPNPNDFKCYGVDLDAPLTDPYKDTTRDRNYDFVNEFSYTVEEFAQYFPQPGVFYSYSNIGIGLVGEFLGEQFNTTFEDYLTQNVLLPFGMKNTVIDMPCERTKSCQNLARVYNKEDLTKNWNEASLWHLPGMSAAGGIRSTLNDMSKFLHANLSPERTSLEDALNIGQSQLLDSTNSHNQNICSPGQQPQVDLCNPAKKDFYYAWEAVSSDTVLYHGGATGASQAMMMFSVDRSLGVVVLSNSRVNNEKQQNRHYPNDVALCIFQLLGKPVLSAYDFCKLLR